MLLLRAFIAHWYQTNLTAYAVKTLEQKKNHLMFPTLKIIQTRTYMPFSFRKNSIFPSLIRAELNYLFSIGQVMLLRPRCPHILFLFLCSE